jgi:hypothetical protein
MVIIDLEKSWRSKSENHSKTKINIILDKFIRTTKKIGFIKRKTIQKNGSKFEFIIKQSEG